MKTILLLLIICWNISEGKVSAQISNSEPQSKVLPTKADLLLKKAKSQKTFGWILAVSGASALAMTYIYINEEIERDLLANPYKSIGRGGAIVTCTLLAASIPLFKASARNRKKAAAILKYESIGFLPPASAEKGFLAVGIQINL